MDRELRGLGRLELWEGVGFNGEGQVGWFGFGTEEEGEDDGDSWFVKV
jgi:hypothetical protein